MAFLGSYAFKEGHSHETISTICDLWSGKPISIAQGHMDEIVYASDRALSLSLALQPEFATRFLLSRQFVAQGLIPRSLITFPRPTLLEPSDQLPETLPREDYYARLEEILELPDKNDPILGNIRFRPLTMSAKAQQSVKKLQRSSRKLAFDNEDNIKYSSGNRSSGRTRFKFNPPLQHVNHKPFFRSPLLPFSRLTQVLF